MYIAIGRKTILAIPCELTFAYSTTPHSTTGHTPYNLMFGYHPRLPIDFWVGSEGAVHGGVSNTDPMEEWVLRHQLSAQMTWKLVF